LYEDFPFFPHTVLCVISLRLRRNFSEAIELEYLFHSQYLSYSFDMVVYAPVANRRVEVIKWFSALLPEFSLPLDSSDEELRELLSDGTVLCHVVNTLIPGVLEVELYALGYLRS
jgi:hypothetical protein